MRENLRGQTSNQHACGIALLHNKICLVLGLVIYVLIITTVADSNQVVLLH